MIMLQQQIVAGRSMIIGSQFPLVRKHLQKPLILGVESVVGNPPYRAELMSLRIDERAVFEVFEEVPRHRINTDQLRLQMLATASEKCVLMEQILPRF